MVKLDWLEGTIKNQEQKSVLADLKALFLYEWTELERGGYGYSHSAIVFETGRVFWSPQRPEMGVHVSMTSKSLAASCQDASYLTLASDLERMGMEFTRVDFCADDTTGLLDVNKIASMVEQQEQAGQKCGIVRKSTKWRIINSDSGKTIYFGSRFSDQFVRIYDKAAEQKEHGHRVRVELELHNKRANLALQTILHSLRTHGQCDVDELVFGWLRSVVDFRTPDASDSNRSRWIIADWWGEFIAFCKQIRLMIPKKIRTAEQVVDWVDKQCAPSLLVAMSVLGSDGLLEKISESVPRLKPKHIAMMRGEIIKV